MVYIIDARNNVGHPTQKHDMIRRLIKKGCAKIVRRLGNNVIVVQLLNKVFDESKTIECEFRIGIDPGYTHIGFAIPYDTSLTNPLQLSSKRVETYSSYRILEGAVEQQEPNGIFASKNTTATWVISVDADTSQILPIYVESKVTVYPYPVTVDYENNRVYKAGKASTSLVK